MDNKGAPQRPSFKPSEEMRESIQSQTDVVLGITKELLRTIGKAENVVYSPLSIYVVLCMIVSGTKQGHIQDQLLRFLKFKTMKELNDLASSVVPLVIADGSSSGGPCLSFANGVWVEKTLDVKPCFKNVLETLYKGKLLQVDFKTEAEEARCQVNSWAEEETKGVIKEILPQGTVTSMTKIILGNALYFKGAWDQQFNASDTRKHKFYVDNKSSVKVPFMTTRGSEQYISAFDDFKVLKLGYKRGGDYERRFAMYVFLPTEIDGLPTLVERVCSPGFINRHLPYGKVPVGSFLIPKFKITFGFEAFEFLVSLGFHPQDLTEMVEEDDISLKQILHKSFIEVNEEGTEAAAVTVSFGRQASKCARPRPIDFVADHPFLYLIREQMTGIVMFIGHVLNPIAE